MKTECDFDSSPNPDIVIIHLDKRVSERDRYFTCRDDAYTASNIPVPQWVLEIFHLPGVEMVSLEQYAVHIKKGRLFSWDNIIEPALDILWEEFAEVCY